MDDVLLREICAWVGKRARRVLRPIIDLQGRFWLGFQRSEWRRRSCRQVAVSTVAYCVWASGFGPAGALQPAMQQREQRSNEQGTGPASVYAFLPLATPQLPLRQNARVPALPPTSRVRVFALDVHGLDRRLQPVCRIRFVHVMQHQHSRLKECRRIRNVPCPAMSGADPCTASKNSALLAEVRSRNKPQAANECRRTNR